MVVAGGGAAGMMAAITAARFGAEVLLLEPNEKVGRKLYITGKGRCNLTNNCGRDGLMASIPRNGKFLYSAFDRFGPADTMAFFEGLGVKLKTERGNRVFPVSDKAADIVDALFFELRRQGVEIRRDRVTGLVVQEGRLAAVHMEKGREYRDCKALILATGGASYPRTGSTGEGHRMAVEAGHTVTPLRGSLVPLRDFGVGRELQGLSLRNVGLAVFEDSRKIYTDFGELVFTHFGLSGPLILSASAHMRRFGERAYHLELDLKPALDEAALDRRLLSDFKKYGNHDFCNALDDLLPKKMIPRIVRDSGIAPRQKVHDLTKEQRRGLLQILKHFPVVIAGPCPVTDAIVTSGGVKVKEIHPATMESKRIRGLYFAGELIDVDAYTGGFNLQIAWSTGRAAGLAAGVGGSSSETGK